MSTNIAQQNDPSNPKPLEMLKDKVLTALILLGVLGGIAWFATRDNSAGDIPSGSLRPGPAFPRQDEMGYRQDRRTTPPLPGNDPPRTLGAAQSERTQSQSHVPTQTGVSEFAREVVSDFAKRMFEIHKFDVFLFASRDELERQVQTYIDRRKGWMSKHELLGYIDLELLDVATAILRERQNQLLEARGIDLEQVVPPTTHDFFGEGLWIDRYDPLDPWW